MHTAHDAGRLGREAGKEETDKPRVVDILVDAGPRKMYKKLSREESLSEMATTTGRWRKTFRQPCPRCTALTYLCEHCLE